MTKTKEILEHIVEVLLQKEIINEKFIGELNYEWFLQKYLIMVLILMRRA